MKISFTDPSLAKIKLLKHGFFTRNGGVSEGVYSSLNCGKNTGDDYNKVSKNREIAMKSLGYGINNLCSIKQIHSDIVMAVSDFHAIDGNAEGDGLVTDQPNICIGITTADCAPVLFADSENRVVGAAHAGWRGAKAGIVEKTVAAMQRLGANLDNIIAVIGPCIGSDSYQVGDEFYDNFIKESIRNKKFFKYDEATARYIFDLGSYIEAKLLVMGVDQVRNVRKDTLADENFFSYRRSCLNNEENFGCQLSVIGMI